MNSQIFNLKSNLQLKLSTDLNIAKINPNIKGPLLPQIIENEQEMSHYYPPHQQT